MNILALGLSKSQDKRIVWQTCILLSGIFLTKLNTTLQTLMLKWALFKGQTGTDFISSCLIARKNHQELSSVILKLFYEVANIGRQRWKVSDINQSKLVELFADQLPQYFNIDSEYFEMISEVMDMHHLHTENDRVDKQHMLLRIVDACLF